MLPLSILIVEDSESLALTYKDFLERAGYAARHAATMKAANAALQQDPAAILLDLNLPDGNGIAFLTALRAQKIRTPVIVVTADTSVETALAAIRAGADDFISKPVTPERLAVTLGNILERHALKSIVSSYRATERDRFCDFIGKSPAMQVVYRIIENAAESRAPVFITGESGTGKELAARAIHMSGKRKTRKCEALNCAAIPANLLESEIFGHVKGAFTGALASSAGAAHRADGGTLFLDELGEMPIELQSKLLRFTQTGRFRPIGAQEEFSADVRFISATNRDPLSAVQEGKLREDLYYRLNVIPIHLPPLRERGEDIIMIAEHLVKTMAREENKKFQTLSEDTKGLLMSAPWPGNVRQLENVLRRAVVLHDGEELAPSMLSLTEEAPAPQAPSSSPSSPGIMPLAEVERRAIEQAIALCGGNITEAARRLKINPSTIHRKMEKWRA